MSDHVSTLTNKHFKIIAIYLPKYIFHTNVFTITIPGRKCIQIECNIWCVVYMKLCSRLTLGWPAILSSISIPAILTDLMKNWGHKVQGKEQSRCQVSELTPTS